MTEQVEAIAPADQAFTGSDKHALGDLQLFPWTPERIIAFQAMGGLYPHIGAEGWDQYQRTKMYPGCLKDITCALWLCTITDSPRFDTDGKQIQEWTVEQADCAPKDAYKTAKKWAGALGILKPDSKEFWEAYGKFAEITKEVSDAATQPVSTGDGMEDDGPNG